MLISKEKSLSRIEIDSMREILFLYYPKYRSKTYEELASLLNENFDRDDITGKMLFLIDEPSISDEVEDLKLIYKHIN